MDHPYPWLKYLPADDLEDQSVDFDGMNIVSPSGEDLGNVEGFIVDADSGRPYYVGVDAGGWFKSKHFLLPIGHVTFNSDDEGDRLIADISRERIDRFPGFDKDEFDKVTPESVKQLNDEICEACGASPGSYRPDEPYNAAWDRPDYRYPDWWHAEPSLPERMGGFVEKELVDYPPEKKTADPVRDRMTGSDRKSGSKPDPSPHFDGRAQPGDVLGLETGGERTYVGDTAEDENKRREDAELAGKKT